MKALAIKAKLRRDELEKFKAKHLLLRNAQLDKVADALRKRVEFEKEQRVLLQR